MSENEFSLFEKLYPIVYQCFYKGENRNKIIKTRLPQYSEDSFVMPTELQSRKILKDKVLMDYSKSEKDLSDKIKISKDCKYRSLTYKILPLLHDRFYQEWESLNVSKFKNKELEEIDNITVSNGVLVSDKPFKFLESCGKISIFIVVNNSKNQIVLDGIYTNVIFKIGYIVDEKIKIKFSTYLNKLKIECEENNDGEIIIVNNDNLNMEVKIFLDLNSAKEYRRKHIEKEIDLLNIEIDLKKLEIEKL